MDHDPIYGQFSGENDGPNHGMGGAIYQQPRFIGRIPMVTSCRDASQAPVTRRIRLHCRSICAGASHHTLGHEEN
jgi:hypothetical protein